MTYFCSSSFQPVFVYCGCCVVQILTESLNKPLVNDLSHILSAVLSFNRDVTVR